MSAALGQLRTAYLGLEIPDPSTLTSFFGDVVGLVAGQPLHGGGLTWRNDDLVHRILVEPGTRNDATVIGLEAADDAAFEATLARLLGAGFEAVESTDAALLHARRVDRLAVTPSPWGVDVEIVTGLAAADEPFTSEAMPGGFLTGELGFGHVVFGTTSFDESRRFVVDGLGFGQSDWLEMELAAGISLEVRFFHCNPRHHSIALARTPFDLPQCLHHVMVETIDRDDVGHAFDRAFASGLPIPNGLGKHPNDGMFSFYVQSPAGFQVEVGHGARTVSDEWDDDRPYDRISAWGHQPVARG